MQGHGYKGQCNVTQSTESDMQCIRVHGKASELIRDVQSSVHRHHPPSEVSLVVGDLWGVGWMWRGGNGGSLG